MKFFNIILHGVPEGQRVWCSDALTIDKYIDTFYERPSNPLETLFQVEVQHEDRLCVCYYHYLKYREIVGRGGRKGSYFGFTLRTDALCADVPLLFRHMDELFRTDLVGTVLERTATGYKHTVGDYAERAAELNRLVDDFGRWLRKPAVAMLFGNAASLPPGKQRPVIAAIDDWSDAGAVLRVLKQGIILRLSPDEPRAAQVREKKGLEERLARSVAEAAEAAEAAKRSAAEHRKEIETITAECNELRRQVQKRDGEMRELEQRAEANQDIKQLIPQLTQALSVYFGLGGGDKET